MLAADDAGPLTSAAPPRGGSANHDHAIRIAPPTHAEARQIRRFNRAKRLIDLAILAATAPLTIPLGFVVAGFVRLRLGRPILYSQSRVGLGGAEFVILKFRSMTSTRDAAGALLPDADRLTPAGRLLRRTSLDELPQLLNIARGEMSLIGPRPLFPRYNDNYTPREQTRHWVRPGVTGLAQATGRNHLGWDHRLELDARYALRRSIRADIAVAFKTLRKVLTGADIAVVAGTTGQPLDVARAQRLRLRHLRTEDLARRVTWMQHPGIREHMQIADDVTLVSTELWFGEAVKNPHRHDFVCYRSDGEPLAMTGLNEGTAAAREAIFYIFVSPGLHGRGIGTEATKLTCEWAFYARGLDAVTLTVSVQNRAAVQIYEKLGFERVAETSTATRLVMRLTRAGYEKGRS